MQQGALAPLHGLGLDHEAADEEVDDAEQDEHGEHVGHQPVDVADHAEVEGGEPAARQQAHQGVEHVDQQVEHEAVEDEGVEGAGDGPRAEHGLLAHSAQNAVYDALNDAVQARDGGLPVAPRHCTEHLGPLVLG